MASLWASVTVGEFASIPHDVKKCASNVSIVLDRCTEKHYHLNMVETHNEARREAFQTLRFISAVADGLRNSPTAGRAAQLMEHARMTGLTALINDVYAVSQGKLEASVAVATADRLHTLTMEIEGIAQ